MGINKYFDRIFIINLKRRTDRKEKMIKRMNKTGITNYEFVEAINGYEEPYLSMYHKKYRTNMFFENPGAFGILLSALKVLVWSVKQNYKKILILEDDAVFHLNFKETFQENIKKIPSTWKLLYFGTSMHKWRLKERCTYEDGYLTAEGSIPGAFAIGIDSSIFLDLIKYILEARKAWDIDPLKQINIKYHSDVYVFNPYLIVCETIDSDIRKSKHLNEKVRSSKWDLSLYDWN
jgi:GR25 family glycosyltransferase involved in LPS biosynthesis